MTLIIVLATLIGEYTAVEIPAHPDTGTVSRVWVTDDGMVAGNWYRYVAPGHAGDVLSKPFVFREGKLTALPLAGGKYGHVLAGDSRGLVGSSETKDAHVPVMWKPDPKTGWNNPVLTILDAKQGVARAVEWQKNTIWITHSDDTVWKWLDGKVSFAKFGKFDLVGVDEKGRWFGNTYTGNSGFSGGDRSGQLAARHDKEGTHYLAHDGYEPTILRAINRKGVGIGTALRKGWKAVIWENGEIRVIPGMDTPIGINDSGHVVGWYENKACLWNGASIVDLSKAVPGVALEEANSINNSGAILAETGGIDNQRLFLLTPKK